MGWTPGTGLGKRRDGRTSHVQVTKRVDAAGLGSERVAKQVALQQQDCWWSDSIQDTLAKLSKTKKKKVFTDDELFEATGGKRFGMRAAPTLNLHKWRRTNDDADRTADNTATDASRQGQQQPATSNDNVETTTKKKRKVETEQLSVDSTLEKEQKRIKKEKKRIKKEKKRAKKFDRG
jgi:hypothetical protein